MKAATTRVRSELKRQKKTQAWLAQQVRISEAHLSMILNGTRYPSMRLAIRLEEVTGVPMRDFAQAS